MLPSPLIPTNNSLLKKNSSTQLFNNKASGSSHTKSISQISNHKISNARKSSLDSFNLSENSCRMSMHPITDQTECNINVNGIPVSSKLNGLEMTEEAYTIFFKNPKQILEIIQKIEEKNIQQIQLNQDSEILILDLRKKKKDLGIENHEKMDIFETTKNGLFEKIGFAENEISRLQKKNKSFERTNFNLNLEQVKTLVFIIFQNFKFDFDKKINFESLRDFDEKENLMRCLSQIESLIYKYFTSLKNDDPAFVHQEVL